MLKLKLQLFAEGMDAGGASAAGAGQSGLGAGTQEPQDAAMQAAGGMPPQNQQPQGGPGGRVPFKQLIQGEYRQDYEQAVGQRIQGAIAQRFRNQQDWQGQVKSYAPIMQALSHKYGLDAADVNGISQKIQEEAWAEEANEKGLPLDVVRSMHQVQEERDQYRSQAEEARQDRLLQQHFAQLQQQEAELRKSFPGFDLMAELQNNPRFGELTRPGGMSVQEAFYALHGPEIQAQGMQYAYQQAGRNIAASVQAGAARPLENGMQRAQPASFGLDVRSLTPQQRAEIRARIERGERVTFS